MLILNLLVTLILANIGSIFGARFSAPNPSSCRRTSIIADLLCYVNQPAPGQSFAVVGFENQVAAYVSYYLNCQPAKINSFDVLDVYGYLFNLSYPVKKSCGTYKAYKLWYVDLSVAGCPQIMEVTTDYFKNYNTSNFKEGIIHGPSPTDQVYYAFQSLYADYPTPCNNFPTGKSCSDEKSCCPYVSPYDSKKPVVSLDFSNIKSIAVIQATSGDNNTSTAQRFVNNYGLSATCTPEQNVTGVSGQLQIDYCTANNSDTFPYCNVADPKYSFSRLVESYGYDKYLSTFDQNKACTVSTLFAQGYNQQNQCNKNYATCNCNSFTSFCGISFIIDGGGQNPEELGIIFLLLRGYCENSFQESILRDVLTIC